MTALTLYDISNQLQQLSQLTDSDDLPAEVIADTLEAITGTFEDKCVAVAKMVLSLQANAAAVKDAADAMAARAARIGKRADSLKSYLTFHMQATQTKRVETPEIVLRLQANPKSVIVTNEAAIPPQYWVEPEPPPKRLDKKALKQALEDGAVIDGAYLDQGEHLRISL